MKLYLGVDGGQSGTAATIGDETGRILGQGSAGPCNHAALGEGRAKLERAITNSVGDACREAGLKFGSVRFEVACFGMSGGPEDKVEILAALLPSEKLVVTTDAVTALAGATSSGCGIITIAGTGSIGFGRNAAGKTARAGGWGYVFGDEGSAFDIGRQATRAALAMDEGWGPPTRLRDLFLGATSTTTANELLHLFYTDEWPRSRVATLAPLVDQAAQDGDAIAMQILNRAAIELAKLAASIRSQLWTSGQPVDVAYIGGVFYSDTVREKFRMLVEMEEGCHCAAPLHGPEKGALLEAYRQGGLNPELRKGISASPA